MKNHAVAGGTWASFTNADLQCVSQCILLPERRRCWNGSDCYADGDLRVAASLGSDCFGAGTSASSTLRQARLLHTKKSLRSSQIQQSGPSAVTEAQDDNAVNSGGGWVWRRATWAVWGRAARRAWSSAAWAVRLGWFRVCVRTGVACVWFRAVCANVCVWYVVSEYAWCLARVSPGVSMKSVRGVGG